MMGCDKCLKLGGVLFAVLGILFLLQDLEIWPFWNISWYTALFVVIGVAHLGSSTCADCRAIRTGKKK